MKAWLFLMCLMGAILNSSDLTGEDRSYQKLNSAWLEVEIGIIGAASDDILMAAFEQVTQDGLSGLVITLDTPGGALQATRTMVKRILSAPFPVVVWVGPSGAHAGSAGAFITLSGHVAAMAPGTNIGAAHPIQASGQDIEEGEAAKKIENDTIAFMESIADLRGRNKEMAISFVENSLSITAEEALENKVIDFVEPSLQSLFKTMDGKVVTVRDEKQVTLETASVDVVRYEKNLRQEFLEILSNPNVFYLLFVAGIIGIGFELTHPGSMVPGVIGGICIIIALISTSVLPINFGAMILILASIAFMIAEVFIPSFGILGIGGFIAFVIGSVLLVDSSNELGLRISWFTIVPGALAIAGFGAAVAWLVYKVEKSKVTSGAEGIVGKQGLVLNDFVEGQGQVRLEGEIWSAQSMNQESFSKGQEVVVDSRNGLRLIVKAKV
ncbi:NfeD family protein [Pseudobacteriovorax antillogorgiicola]|uniref:Membrane-bound serine protease (ClpP class) n=1 Tax=Pseudobacteriovorax antillogorgiicola TaxID=1513793 RepID=A0A1Y6C7C1_9BACT|nr:nodulation protein NfeD [Pseudobacteriovorax antillogorgiicola]TCS49416.1 membrane-bound serine protease (ClpP class) [Pseudobacteriovorax antillogorgiicola]SMF46910.1 membrane-bound serine protease (ClpP class) [Pseudobacteriovorax antillogorgiicola]